MAVDPDPHHVSHDNFDIENPPKKGGYEHTIDIIMLDTDNINVSSDIENLWDRRKRGTQLLNKIYNTNEAALSIRTEIKDWFNENDISYKYSVYFGIMYFTNEEDKVKFILRWL